VTSVTLRPKKSNSNPIGIVVPQLSQFRPRSVPTVASIGAKGAGS
jgi:hypothetical protein